MTFPFKKIYCAAACVKMLVGGGDFSGEYQQKLAGIVSR